MFSLLYKVSFAFALTSLSLTDGQLLWNEPGVNWKRGRNFHRPFNSVERGFKSK